MASRSRRPADQRAPSQRAPAQRAPVQPEEENINIDDVGSSSSGSEDTPAPPPAKARATRAGGHGALVPDEETTRVAPIVKPVVKSNRALDIDLIFDRAKGKPSVCKYCK
jgi:hypothetical protein